MWKVIWGSIKCQLFCVFFSLLTPADPMRSQKRILISSSKVIATSEPASKGKTRAMDAKEGNRIPLNTFVTHSHFFYRSNFFLSLKIYFYQRSAQFSQRTRG